MTTSTPSADLRGRDLRGRIFIQCELRRATFAGADCRGADFQSADVSGADFAGANLAGANLDDALLMSTRFDADTVMPHGETWASYIAASVPALLTSRGVSMQELVDSGTFECHAWGGCPISVAFGVSSIDEIPAGIRPDVERFLTYFDARMITAATLALGPIAAALIDAAETISTATDAVWRACESVREGDTRRDALAVVLDHLDAAARALGDANEAATSTVAA